MSQTTTIDTDGRHINQAGIDLIRSFEGCR